MELFEIKPLDLSNSNYKNSINPFVIEKYLSITKQQILNLWLDEMNNDQKNEFNFWYQDYFGYSNDFSCLFENYVSGYIFLQRSIVNQYLLDPMTALKIIYPTKYKKFKSKNHKLIYLFEKLIKKINFDNKNLTENILNEFILDYDQLEDNIEIRTILKKIIENDFLIEFKYEKPKKGKLISNKINYSKLKYPIFLLHGMAGFKSLGFFKYWGKVIEDLQKKKLFRIHKLSCGYLGTLASSYWRQDTLITSILQIIKENNYEKIHLVGHSQGGIDARIMISACGLSKLVASVSTIGTPHNGIDFYFGSIYRTMKWNPYYMKMLNAQLNKNGVPIISYGGKKEKSKVNIFFRPLQYFWKEENKLKENDGVVSLDSSLFQNVGGIVNADHLELIWDNIENDFNIYLFYKSIFSRLKLFEKID